MTRTADFSPMEHALVLARDAAAQGCVPVAAVIVHNGKIISAEVNAPPSAHDPTGHAEIRAIRAAAAAIGSDRLNGCDMWVTLEPCAMCAGAIAHARVDRLYFGAGDAKGGAIDHGPRLFSQPTIHHRPEIYGGILEQEAAALLTDFFARRRTNSPARQ